MKKILIPLSIVAALLLSACSAVSTDPDEVALHYSGGDFTSRKFEKCVDSSNREFNGPGDSHFYYPTGTRTFSFTGRDGSELKPLQAKTSNTVNLSVGGYVTFRLKSDCETLRDFHEEIGRKYGAYGEDSGQFSGGALPEGWLKLLNDYLATPLNAAVDNAGLKFDWKTLAYDSDAQTEFEEDVKDNLPKQLNSGFAKYIEIESVTIQPPEPPKDLVESLKAAEKAKAENDAQKQRNETARTKYQSLADCKRELSEESCVLLKLAEDGKVPFLPIPDGSLIDLKGFTSK